MRMKTLTTPSGSRRNGRRGYPTWEIASLFPTQGLWDEDEFLALDTNRLIEYCEGLSGTVNLDWRC